MKLQNTTNITDQRLREMIEFVKPKHLPTSLYTIRITNAAQGYSGRLYPDGFNSNRPHIIVRITKNDGEFPYYESYRKTHRRVIEKYQKFNEEKGVSETWLHTKYEKLPEPGRTGGYIDSLILSREEAVVHILAHELRHLWQKSHRTKRGKVWGARGVYSDRDADAYAIKKQREWRRLHAPKQVFPNMDVLDF